MLTAERLRDLVTYDPETGVMRWKTPRHGVTVGRQLGRIRPDGYLEGCVDGRRYKVHRLAWLYVYGEWPSDQVDHADRNKANNRINNLRMANNAQNQFNQSMGSRNTSGFKGVSYRPKGRRKWMAQIQIDGYKLYLGVFETKEEASAAYQKAAEQMYGQFNPFPESSAQQ